MTTSFANKDRSSHIATLVPSQECAKSPSVASRGAREAMASPLLKVCKVSRASSVGAFARLEFKAAWHCSLSPVGQHSATFVKCENFNTSFLPRHLHCHAVAPTHPPSLLRDRNRH
ncbi:hypothetical protein TcWFU_008288 [Taenia crassiceps]|uniref:Uncharacterized protein n=1 Tax=Taenia crassiceps TaxID=6207 RepID=A0ABR4QHR6_9CEST